MSTPSGHELDRRLRSHLYWYRAFVTRVIDGDTLVMHLDLGAGHALPCTKWPGGPEASYPQGRYRLWGINTPEKKDAKPWLAATERVKELLSLGSEGDVVYVKTHKVGGRGRLVIDVWIPRADRDGNPIEPLHLNRALLHEGHAKTYQDKRESEYWPLGGSLP
jgi:endonuclease YncB( thermonuclease family)